MKTVLELEQLLMNSSGNRTILKMLLEPRRRGWLQRARLVLGKC